MPNQIRKEIECVCWEVFGEMINEKEVQRKAT